MIWGFWKRNDPKKPETVEPSWPSDSFESVRALLYFWAKNEEMRPFAEWRQFISELTPELQRNCEYMFKGFMLSIWFWMFEAKFSKVHATLAKDAFLELIGQMDHDLSAQTEWLLDVHTQALQMALNPPADISKVTIDGEAIELPWMYHYGMYLLVKMPDSPYHGTISDSGPTDTAELARALQAARTATMQFYKPMLDAVLDFSAGSYPSWRWSKVPGAFERQLQRRHGSPYFPMNRRHVSPNEVLEARLKDEGASTEAIRMAMEASSEFDQESLPENVGEWLVRTREKFDAAWIRLIQVGGGAATKQIDHVEKMRGFVIEIWRKRLQGNTSALEALQEAESAALAARQRLLGSGWRQALGHPGHPIPNDEVFSSLMAEPLSSLTAAIAEMRSEPSLASTFELARKECVGILRRAINDGADPDAVSVRASLLSIEL